MIRDRDVFISKLTRAEHHVHDGIAAVAPGAVHVEVAAHVKGGDERRQETALRRDDLVFTLAELGRDVRKIEQTIERLLVGHEQTTARGAFEMRVRKPEAERCCSRLQPLRVSARPGVPDERRTGHVRTRYMNFQKATVGRYPEARR